MDLSMIDSQKKGDFGRVYKIFPKLFFFQPFPMTVNFILIFLPPPPCLKVIFFLFFILFYFFLY